MLESKPPDGRNGVEVKNETADLNRPDRKEKRKENSIEKAQCCKINRNYAPIKAHYFLMYGGMGGAMPYIQVVAKDFGVSSTAVGIIFTIVPIFVFFAKPLFGFITDKLRNITVILLILLVTTAVSYNAMLHVPPIKNNDAVSIQITPACVEAGKELTIDPPSYNSACAGEIMNRQFQCNFTSDSCIKEGSLPGTLNVSSTFPVEENVTLALAFKFKDKISSTEECDCFKRNSSHLICETSTSECDSFKHIRKTSEYKLYNFWIFALLAILSGTGAATIFCLSDAACNEVVSDSPRSFGNQRLWGTISWGITTLGSGYLNDIASDRSGNTNYSPGFYLLLVFFGIDIILLCKLRLKKASISPSICKDVGKIFASWQTVVFSLGVYVCGALAGLLWTFEFWYLTELGSSPLLLGLTAAVQCLVSEVPFFFFSGWLIQKFGHFYCLIASLAAYALRTGLYSVLQNPWMVLPIDLLHGITYAIFCAAMTLYAVDCAPPGTEATMLGVLGGIFEGLGVATGSFLGGIGFDNMGSRWTFFVTSMITLACVPIFTVAYKILQRSKGRLVMDQDLTTYANETTNYGTEN